MYALVHEQSTVIGIYGPGGVGKTTLLEDVQKKLSNEKRSFDLIVTTTVSQTADLKKIQHNIADALSLDLKSEPSGVGRRDLLFSKLQSEPTKKVLIILDELRAPLDLKAVGIPFGDESKGCKLLLASRYKHVLERTRADRTFSLASLNNNEALKLFEKTMGDRLKDDEELKAIAAQVVEKLGGLPLWIMPVASTLKYSGVSAWNNALKNLDVEKKETMVKWIYDHLESEDAKSLFLLCGLIGGTIRVETLLVLGMGLGLFDGFNMTMHDSRYRLNTTLDSLRSICLLQDGGDEKEDVTIHDLYSEVVVSAPFRDQNSLMMNSNYGSRTREELEKCWAICLVDAFGDRLAELMMCTFPKLKILMLCPREDWIGDPAHQHDEGLLDFQYMKELRVLYLRSMHITTLPSSIEILVNLRSLHLDDCLVEDVTILGKLKALQILSIAGSAIYRLPEEIGELINLRSLNLSNCNMLQIIEPGVLESLINLEELHMKRSVDRLEISVRDPTILLEDGDLPFENLIRFCIHLGNVEGRMFQGLRTMELEWEECDNVLSRGWVQKTLHETQYLHLDGLRESKENAHELCTQGFGQLKHLDILNSPSIKYIANSSEGLPLPDFTILESLFLENLINLEKICHGPVHLSVLAN
ncbi:hypothetical protein ACJRO7_027443 [Eucalyptus globulus]|uniref:AAA+ ATPase domain-containing protein n=1 Tax=Eucalyptus globulus TaxID=34317 RepID=A0ABD3K3U6_EUCGL